MTSKKSKTSFMTEFANSENILSGNQDIIGKIKWRSPSNIAIVKYWGKYGNQLPRNPSISLSLSKAHTTTEVRYRRKKGKGISIHFNFEGQEHEGFKKRIVRFLEEIKQYFPFIHQLHLDISSENSFPHSSGIASSASAMSALALCLCDLERILFPESYETESFLKKASFISRLGSGSASRSLFPIASIWGETDYQPEASKLFGIDVSQSVASVFHDFHDDILIVSKKKKEVSSSLGHKLMETNRFAKERYTQAHEKLGSVYAAMKEGDVEKFGELAEEEALVLHALMMCSSPSFVLMEGNTIEMIKRIRNFRKQTKTQVYFTLDAGPNIHLLYPDFEKKKVQAFVNNELLSLCENEMIIRDKVGKGPQKIY